MGLEYRNAYEKRKDKVMLMIEESMKEYNIDPKTVPGGKKGRVVQYCNGTFTCQNCVGQTWRSTWSWILFDLRQQKIRYRFHQKCASCMTPTKPYLDDDKMKKLVDKVCRKYLRRINEDVPDDVEEPVYPQDDQTELANMRALFQSAVKSTNKHRQKLCEKCGYGNLEPCYASVLRKYRDYFETFEKVDFLDTHEE